MQAWARDGVACDSIAAIRMPAAAGIRAFSSNHRTGSNNEKRCRTGPPKKLLANSKPEQGARKRESKLPQFGTLNSIRPLVETPTQFAAQFQRMWSTRHSCATGA